MDRTLSKVWNSRYGKYLLPLSFCVGNLVNVMFYYLGLAFQDNIARQTGFVIGNVLFASVAFLALLSTLRFSHLKLKSLFPLGLVLLFFCRLLHQGAGTLWIYRNVDSSCRSVFLFFIPRILHRRLRGTEAVRSSFL